MAIGTSATVASGHGGLEALARFARTLFGEAVRTEDIVAESYAARTERAKSYCPPFPDLNVSELALLDPSNNAQVVVLAERLPEMAHSAQEALYGHDCVKACYLCLKHYRN